MPSRIHVTLRLPLVAEALAVAEELADVAVGLMDLREEGAGDALPCRLSHDLHIDARGLQSRAFPVSGVRDGDLLLCGLAPDLDKSTEWRTGRTEFTSGTPVLAELFAMLDPAVDVPVGTILGSIGEAGSMRHAGPVVMTSSGPRWCQSDSSYGDEEDDWNHFLGIPPIVFSRLPGWSLRPAEGADGRAWADVDRAGLRAFVEDECMKRARCGVRRLPPPRRRREDEACALRRSRASTQDGPKRMTAWAT